MCHRETQLRALQGQLRRGPIGLSLGCWRLKGPFRAGDLHEQVRDGDLGPALEESGKTALP